MQTKKPYKYGGKEFRTLGEIKKHIQGVLNYDNRVVGNEFFDDVLADVVVERHYRWAPRGVRPTSFMFMANEDGDNRTWGDSLAGLFGEWGWCRFSYKKALRNKQTTLKSEFPRICRQRWSSHWQVAIKNRSVLCETSGCGCLAEDVDHIEPQHSAIVSACWEILSDSDRAEWWEAIVAEAPGSPHFVLPEEHPVTALYDSMTWGGKYQCLCAAHHREETSLRKQRESG